MPTTSSERWSRAGDRTPIWGVSASDVVLEVVALADGTGRVDVAGGLLLDRGFAIAKSITRARRAIPEILSNFDNELTPLAREAILELYDLFRDLDRRIATFDKKIREAQHRREARLHP